MVTGIQPLYGNREAVCDFTFTSASLLSVLLALKKFGGAKGLDAPSIFFHLRNVFGY
jgi:hypothetical protein